MEAGRAQGMDIVGVDVFYAGNRSKATVERKGLLGKVVFEVLEEGTIPFGFWSRAEYSLLCFRRGMCGGKGTAGFHSRIGSAPPATCATHTCD